MNSITNCLDQLQRLTQRNLEILKAINDSFFTNQTHIAVNIGDINYAIPSFISLENKINYLQENFNNLINAPKTGEAYFNLDGNSRAIEVRGYTHTPNSIVLPNINTFGYETNNIFKDFLSPKPYINIDLSSFPNDITSTNVKKIIPKNQELIDRFKSLLGDNASSQYRWGDMYKILVLYKKDVDYIEYDTIRKLPIRNNIGQGNYIIEEILNDRIDDNLEEYIKIKLHTDLPEPFINNLTYKLFDETISKTLEIGDELVTYDDSAKMQIIEIDHNNNTLTVKVLNGEYLNLGQTKGTTLESTTDPALIDDLCKIKFYSPINFNSDKYIHIPLEEDQYVYIAVAALNDRMNIQSPWGTGLVLNTFNLLSDSGVGFEQYYDENVRNIGDILYEMTYATPSTVNSLTYSEYLSLVNTKPVIDTNNLEVVQINKHLNNSTTIQNIRAEYSMKSSYKTMLSEVQSKIMNVNKNIDLISFSGTTGERDNLLRQREALIAEKNELIDSINKSINNISSYANDSDIVIENAKYHIRGFFDYDKYANSIGVKAQNHIKGIQVYYRYKNVNSKQGEAQTINDSFLYSDWNIMSGFLNPKYSGYNETDGYYFYNQPNNNTSNEPSFNQIDIPISQGETVDIKLKVIYDYGYPFAETSSVWSDIVNITFPEELSIEVPILTIIEENNNDIETNRFINILKDNGVIEHIDEKFSDQGVVYLHKPEDISSGFFTNELRVIPLSSKLQEMNSKIISLEDEVAGTFSENLSVELSCGDIKTQLLPLQTNNISVEAYEVFIGSDLQDTPVAEGNYVVNNGVVSTVLNLKLINNSNRSLKLYSVFPGSRDVYINDLKNYKFDINDYSTGKSADSKGGVWLNYVEVSDNNSVSKYGLQTANQFITFRINDPFDGGIYYKKYKDSAAEEDFATFDNRYLSLDSEMYEVDFGTKIGARMYPSIREKYYLCLNNNSSNTYLELAPGDSINTPIVFEYKLKDDSTQNQISVVSKTMSFDVRTSLYSDPVNYTFVVTAKMNNATQDKNIATSNRYSDDIGYSSSVTK